MFDTQDVLTRCRIAPVQSGTYASSFGWAPTEGRKTFDAVCPADGKLSARIAGSTAADYDAVVACAQQAHLRWRMTPAPRRGEVVRRIGELMEENFKTLAAAIMLDTGKAPMDAERELREAIDMATLAAGQSRMLFGYTQQSQREKHRAYDQWLPLGVVGIISAYNAPGAIWAQNGFLAAIGGNTIIWKPHPKVPLTAIALQHLANQVMKEYDCEGVFSLFLPEDNEVAELLVADKRIALISFTGSSRIGHRVADVVSASLGRRYLLECSGNNGCIVDETADLKQAARAITFGVIGVTGQLCTSTRRVIAHRSIADELVGLLKIAFKQIKVGDPRDAGTVVGPLIDPAAVGHFEAAIHTATELGGQVVQGGKRIDRPGNYVEPTIITGARPDWPCVQRETFAPIVYVMQYDDLDEAIRIHNGVAQGLAAGMHTTNLCNLETFLSAAGSDTGMVRINMGTTGADVGQAFGGEKETGFGRVGGSDAWKGYMRRQSVCVNWSGTSPWDSRIAL
jgi:aldehyde dehydrogenase (NAD+)